MSLPVIPQRDYRTGGLLAFAQDHRERALNVMETVLDGFGLAGKALTLALPLADRVAARRLAAMNDPYAPEIHAIREALGVAGPVAFSLSYEFGCTARAFSDGATPTLFRTLDWPFKGLGALVEIVHLSSPHGDWVTATWPGLTGILHGAAKGRFAIALNQAPERTGGFGRAISWLAAKRRFMRATGLPPPHLLRQVFETAPDFDTACAMLARTPIAVPVIFTIVGADGQAAMIERSEQDTEIRSSDQDIPAAANHFAADVAGRWRARGYDSTGRREAAVALTASPALDDLAPPILNPLTRLAVRMDTNGGFAIVGYEGAERVTEIAHTTGPEASAA